MIMAMAIAVPRIEITLINRFSLSIWNACLKYCFIIVLIQFNLVFILVGTHVGNHDPLARELMSETTTRSPGRKPLITSTCS